MTTGVDTPSSSVLDVRPLTTSIGAEVRGVDLRRPASESVRRALRSALLDHGVLFLRGQDLTVEQQIAVASIFGEVNRADFARQGVDELDAYIDVVEDSPDSPPGADYWHTDLVVWEAPPDVAVLNSRVIPPHGGDTLWLSLYALYDALSPTLREMIDGLMVDVRPSTSRVVTDGAGRQRIERLPGIEADAPSAVHPLVRIHPETGRPCLFLMGATMHSLVGLSPKESDAILALLRQGLDDPGIQCRWRWEPHDLVIWDERCTNHRATADHWPAPRFLRRCTAGRSVPIGASSLR